MTIEVDTPGGVVEFPDGTPRETITAALRKKYPPKLRGHTTSAEAPSAAGSFLRGVPRGGLLNFDDEVAAFGNAIVPGMAALDRGVQGTNQRGAWDSKAPEGFWNTVKANLRDLEAQKHRDQDTNPKSEVAGQILGVVGTGRFIPRALGGSRATAQPARGVATATSVAGRAAVPTVLKTAAKAAGVGAAAGAVSGFGAGEGTVDNRARSAVTGLKAGAVIGGGLGLTVAGLTPLVGRYWRAYKGQGAGDEALAQIARALKRDGYDVDSAAGKQALQTELSRWSGKPVSLADLGPATRARTGVGLRSPSEAQRRSVDTVMSRQRGQGERLSRDIRANVAPRTDIHKLDADLVAQRAEDAKTLRDAALFGPKQLPDQTPPRPQITQVPDDPNAGVLRTLGVGPEPSYVPVPVAQPAGPPSPVQPSRVVSDPTLQQLARLPDAQKALQAAVKRAESERALKSVLGKPIDDIPDISAGSDLDVRTFDYLKRFLDDEVRTLYKGADTSTFKAAQASQVKDLRNAIRDRLKSTVPEYGGYLDSYKGSSDLIDALEGGRGYQKLDPEVISAEQGARTAGEQEFYRVGAARRMEDTVRGVSDTGVAQPANRILNNDTERQRVQALGVGDENFQRLANSIDQERQMGELPMELRGSQTDARRIAGEDADAGIQLQTPFNPANPVAWLGFAGRKAARALDLRQNEAVNAALLPRMLEQNPQAIQATIAQLEQAGRTADALKLRRALQATQAARIGGTIIGSPLAIRNGE